MCILRRLSVCVVLLTVQEMLEDLFQPKFFLPKCLQREYPSHMHIDLMRRAQGQGIGTRMIKTLLATLKAKGKLSHL